MIGPTLVACGLLCCLIRVLLCAFPSTCLRKKKRRLTKSDSCPHNTNRYQRSRLDHAHHQSDSSALLSKTKKKVSIVPPTNNQQQPIASTSTHEFKQAPPPPPQYEFDVPQIELPDKSSRDPRHDSASSIIELENLEMMMTYDLQSVTSSGSDSDSNRVTVVESLMTSSKLTRGREAANQKMNHPAEDDLETCLSVVVERSDNSDASGSCKNDVSTSVSNKKKQTTATTCQSGIVLSPLQLGQ